MRKTRWLELVAIGLSAAMLSVGAYAVDAKYREVKVREVVLEPARVTVRVDQVRTLDVYIRPYDADDQTVEWSSSNPEVVMVKDDGYIIGVSPGTAEVTATSINGRSGSCKVTVPAYALGSIRTDTSPGENPLAGVDGGEVLSAMTLRRDVEQAVKDGKSMVAYQNKTTVSTAALRGAAYSAKILGKSVNIQFATLNEDSPDTSTSFFSGGERRETPPTAQGYMTFDPEQSPDQDYNILTSIYTDPARTATIREAATNFLNGPSLCVRLAHASGFGMPVSVCVKIGQEVTNIGALQIYRYNPSIAAFEPLDNQKYTIDSNGFLHFMVTKGGSFAIAGSSK